MRNQSIPADAVAVVGMSCRFPGADGPDEFWRRLTAGFDAVSEVPADRSAPVELFGPGGPPLRAGFIEGVESFDAGLLRDLAARGGGAWIRDSGSCWSWPGRRWSTPGSRRTRLAGSDAGVYVGAIEATLRHPGCRRTVRTRSPSSR